KPATPGDFFGQKDEQDDEGKNGADYVDTTKPAAPGDFFGQKDEQDDEGKNGADYVDTTKPATPDDFFGQKDEQDDEGKNGADYVDTTKPATPGDFFGQKDEQDDEGKNGADYVDNTTDETTTHTVVPGDTVAKIANAHNTTVEQIVKDNGLVDSNYIVPGQELVVNHPVTNTEDLTQTTTHNNNFTTSQDVVDNKELPETGSESNVNSGLLGGLALAAGAVLVGFNRRKEEK
ncbi:LysM peptidoglycan-binding domain-containing protein, partial [Staphylococcus hominis]